MKKEQSLHLHSTAKANTCIVLSMVSYHSYHLAHYWADVVQMLISLC